MKNNHYKRKSLSQFFDENSIYLVIFAVVTSIVLCLLQIIIRPQSVFLLIISLTFLGLFLTGGGFWLFFNPRGKGFSYGLMGAVGVVMLVWAGFLVFKPDAQVSVSTRGFFQTKKKFIDTDLIDIGLDIAPTSYTPGDRGRISIYVKNNSDVVLTLETVMFETKKAFYDGFVIDYETANPPISDRKEKLGLTIALFFLDEALVLNPGGAAEFSVDMVANAPGDYTGDYAVVLFVDAASVASPKSIPDLFKTLQVVVFPSE